ncbi:MAG TPA: hypothetical protein VLJ13_05810, partial [Brevundimonas sp.]|nr:hypothetical protein [Brevundimonas sp.]
MASVVRRILLGGACVVAVVVGAADAQTTSGYASQQNAQQSGPGLITTPPTAVPTALSDTDSANLQTSLAA